ncbi:MAG TPA: clostripain-related cysteine peptidase [Blastocatellia bacterium]|nr:clostripain-related cysteine peptidase [Blastocatellia bacterium]
MKEWTLMFYFASDNALAHEIVFQLKSIKNAGFQQDVNVVAYFDPQPVGTPAHLFDINAVRKAVRRQEVSSPTAIRKQPRNPDDIGFAAEDPFVRDLIEDRLWGNELSRDGETIRQKVIDQLEKDEHITFNPPSLTDAVTKHSDNSGPTKSLRSFLTFCAENYPADHYMLFILGHGLVVGDDVFLLDEHAVKRSVTLRELGKALEEFKGYIGEAQFELVGFHSCSMSGLEVAFQLQGTANYMLASQGPAFVASWPYRQILIRIFKDVAEAKLKRPKDVEIMLGKIFDYVYFNSTDYLLAGYSFDLCLCDLRPEKIKTLEQPINDLSNALVAGLRDEANPLVKYFILLAHWESQSYFQENYTDLYDFCLCLRRYCETPVKANGRAEAISSLATIREACERVRIVLRKQSSNDRYPIDPDNPDNLNERVSSTNPVIEANFAGPHSQFSHGLSVYFPWARPTDDQRIIKQYRRYNFNQTKWFNFLDQCWGKEDGLRSTMRDSHKTEVAKALTKALNAVDAGANNENESPEAMLNEDIVSLMFNAEGPLNVNGTLSGEKPNPQGTTGDECTCGSIKNFPRDTRARSKRGTRAKTSTYPINRNNKRITSS